MAWERYESRRRARPAARRARGTEREYKPLDPAVAESSAQLRRYERYLTELVTVHVECSTPVDWGRMSITPPSAPAYRTLFEDSARAALEAYRPGIADRLAGRAASRRAKFGDAIERAIESDRNHHEAALARHDVAYQRWRALSRLALRVLQLDRAACREALSVLDVFGDIAAFGTRVELDAIADGGATLSCAISDPELVPTHDVAVEPTGALSMREMSPRKYWALYQRHVCSCAIRVAREAIAALPIARVAVNVTVDRRPILAVELTAQLMERLVVRAIDPSDMVRCFPHRMQLHSVTGFESIDAMDVAAPR